MADQQLQTRVISACPWCGDGTELSILGDGLGGLFVMCTNCGCRGPAAPIEKEFSEAREMAISRWSSRAPRVAPDVVERLTRATAMAALLNGGDLKHDAEVSVQHADLKKLLPDNGGSVWRCRGSPPNLVVDDPPADSSG